jgi:hypothetical protein
LRSAQAEPTGKDFSRVMPTVQGSPPAASATVRCQVAGYAACRFPAEELAVLRQRPAPLQGNAVAASSLKHADEQTVAGLAALARALTEDGLQQLDYSQWGVIAAPRFLGRAKLAIVLSRFVVEGAWGISPHLIPHRSQHALSGTISQALKVHGPNYGVGGDPDGAAEALMAAATLLADQRLPGVWVVLSGYDPELVPVVEEGDTGAVPPLATSHCLALALALRPSKLGHHGIFLSVGAAPPAEPTDDWPALTLETFAQHLVNAAAAPAQWRLPCGCWAKWEHAETAVEICL